jgi:hypothetical protein
MKLKYTAFGNNNSREQSCYCTRNETKQKSNKTEKHIILFVIYLNAGTAFLLEVVFLGAKQL